MHTSIPESGLTEFTIKSLGGEAFGIRDVSSSDIQLAVEWESDRWDPVQPLTLHWEGAASGGASIQRVTLTIELTYDGERPLIIETLILPR